MTVLALLLVLGQTPYRLADIETAPASESNSAPDNFKAAGPIAFFYANQSNDSTELWVTDGTDAGTHLVRDIAPGGSIEKNPILVVDAGVVAFVHSDDLYVSDGTAGGTRVRCCATKLVDDAAVLPDGTVLLAVHDDLGARALFRTDASGEGGSLVAALFVDEFLGVVNGVMLLIAAPSGTSTYSLYATDGTPAGTVVLVPGMVSDFGFTQLARIGDAGYSWGRIGGVLQVVRSDGTPAGSQPLGRFDGGTVGGPVIATGPLACFRGSYPSTGAELMCTAGSPGDYRVHVEVAPGAATADVRRLASFGTGVLFLANDGVSGAEPWFTDGFDGGAWRLADVNPGVGSSNPDEFTVNGTRAVFTTSNNGPLWLTDGTPAGTQLVPGLGAGASASRVAAFGSGWLFSRSVSFVANPWFTDGTAAGTREVQQISRRGTESSVPAVFTPFATRIAFGADSTAVGYELYRFEALDGGLARVADLNAGSPDGVYSILGQAGGRLMIGADDDTTGIELYSTSLDDSDITLVKDIRIGFSSSDPWRSVTAGHRMFFAAATAGEGYEMWVTDGTTAGTVMLGDLNPGAANSVVDLFNAEPVALPDGGVITVAEIPAGRYLYGYTANGATRLADDWALWLRAVGPRVFADMCSVNSGCELWSTDGTVAGTREWADVLPGSQSGNPRNFAVEGDRLFFVGDEVDGGRGLFVASPAAPGATRIAGFDVSVFPQPGVGGVFFEVSTPETGPEPWFSDGTTAQRVADIIPGPEGSSPDEFVAAGRRTFFVASDREHGRELWVTDGTAAGTRMVADLVPGPSSSGPVRLTSAYGWLIFRAMDALGDQEPYVLALSEAPPSIVPQVTGQTGGDGGWYVSDVAVSFRVTDPDAPILASSGCGTSRTEIDGGFIGSTLVTQDGPDTVLPCSARTSGGETSTSVSVRRDATAPRISCPGTVVAPATGTMGTVVTFPPPLAVDQIDPAPAVSLSHASGSSFPLGRTVVTATATDHVGHTSDCTFAVEVRDDRAPVAMCPMSQSVPFGTAVTYSASATDDVDPMPMVTSSAPSGTVFPPGRNAVSVVAIDAAGNVDTCAFFIDVASAPDAGNNGMVTGSACGCAASPAGALLLAVVALLRRRRAGRGEAAVGALLLLLAAGSASAAEPAPAKKPKLIVLQLATAGGVEAGIGSALTEAVTTEVSSRGFFEVISSKDVETLLNVERQRELMGCSDEATNCLTELAGALGARFVLNGSVARLGDAYQLNLQTMDSQKAQPLGRSTLIGKDLGVLREQLKYVVAEATATPIPPPPSRVMQFSLIGAGAASILGGAVLGLLAVSQELALSRELSAGDTNPDVLRSRADYQAEVEGFIRPAKTVSIIALIVGAALVVTGVVLMPGETQATGPRVSFVPTASGGALVGFF